MISPSKSQSRFMIPRPHRHANHGQTSMNTRKGTKMKHQAILAAFAAIAAFVFAATSADAATIAVENSDGFVVGGPESLSRTQAFAAGADADMLIVSAGGDTRTILTVSYDGVAMDLIPGTSNGTRVSGIWYLTNPSASGNIVFTLSGTTGTPQDFALAAASISSSDGNPIAVGAADTASGTSLSLNVPEDDSFVFVAVAGNGGTVSTTTGVDQRMAIGTISSMSADAGWDNGVAAGTSPSYGFTTNSSSPVISAASFHVVPTPAALPAGLALLGFVAARRRR